jgi:hypothetical protein
VSYPYEGATRVRCSPVYHPQPPRQFTAEERAWFARQECDRIRADRLAQIARRVLVGRRTAMQSAAGRSPESLRALARLERAIFLSRGLGHLVTSKEAVPC